MVDRKGAERLAILGHGIDIETLDGFELFAEDVDWLARVFSEDELLALPSGPDRVSAICGRWCLKEAVLKALGVGFAEGVWLQDIVMNKDAMGRPGVVLRGDAALASDTLGVTSWHVSISHSDGHVVASAIAEGG